MLDLTRARGTLFFDEGVIIRAYPVAPDRTEIELAPERDAGAIVQDSRTGRWRYDARLRANFGIAEDPDFPTDLEAGNRLPDFLGPLSEINALARGYGERLH